MFDFPYIGALEDAEAGKAIVNPARDEGVEFEEAALEHILLKTEGYPYFLQEWGKHSWEAADESPITLGDTEAASVTATAALDASFFRVRFDRLTPSEKKYLRAMAELGAGPHRSVDIADQLGREVRSLAPTRAISSPRGWCGAPAMATPPSRSRCSTSS